jgi:polyisoprenyl-phosphate glycosyltransferase
MNKKEINISIVSPVYSSPETLKELCDRLIKTLELINCNFEIILVNDCSPQDDWEIIKELASNDVRIKGINLSRNFGQHYAITAGLEFAKGEWIVVMDCDLQDNPEEVINLYNKAIEGYDIVFAQRIKRNDNFLKKMYSKCFYEIFSFLTGTEQDNTIANFGIYNKKAIKAILGMGDYIRYFPTLVQWIGFTKTKIEVEHSRRTTRKSSYTLKSLTRLAFNNMIAFSDKPLKITVFIGIGIVIVSIIMSIWVLKEYFVNNILVSGYTSLILSIWFLSGCIIFILGVVGLYIGKTFEQTKKRPLYIVKNKINII